MLEVSNLPLNNPKQYGDFWPAVNFNFSILKLNFTTSSNLRKWTVATPPLLPRLPQRH